MKRFKVLACKVFYREICLLSANCKNFIDVTYITQGLHDTPDRLHRALQDEIDLIDLGSDIHSFERYEGNDFDAILIGYGLCSNAICGIKSRRYPIVIPKAHDCISLFLGSKEAYREYFDAHSGGVYWYTAGWNENTPMPGEERVIALKKRYTEQYGEENAEYLMEMEQGWLKNYNICTFVDWPELRNDDHIAYTKKSADYLNWNFEVLKGDKSLMQRFLEGEWHDDEFLVLEPGQTVKQSFDCEVMTSDE